MAEKRLIVSMAFGSKSRKFGEITFPLMQKYAQKCEADFHIFFNQDPRFDFIGHQKWQYADLLGTYDRILHIDADMLVRERTPNLFDIVAQDEFAGVDEHKFASPERESPYVDRYKDLIEYAKTNGTSVTPEFYINVGMYLFSKEHKYLFDKAYNLTAYYKEQTELNFKLHTSQVKVKLLDPNFNFMSIMENKGLNRINANMIHYAGNYRGYSDEEIIRMMKRDLNVS